MHLNLLAKNCFAVVGTRKLTSYGKEVTQNIVRGLVHAGFVIVSGLASGIDTIAHKTAISQDGKTIAVLGTPIDQCYPKENCDLQEEIIKQSREIPEGKLTYVSNTGKYETTVRQIIRYLFDSHIIERKSLHIPAA